MAKSFSSPPLNSMKRQKKYDTEGEPPRSIGAQYSTGVEQRNNYGKNEEAESKQK